jgi:hypothetical protein
VLLQPKFGLKKTLNDPCGNRPKRKKQFYDGFPSFCMFMSFTFINFRHFFVAYTVPDVGEVMLASFSNGLFESTISTQNPWYFLFYYFNFILRSAPPPLAFIIYYILLYIIYFVRWIGEKYDGIRAVWNQQQLYPTICISFFFLNPPPTFPFLLYYYLISFLFDICKVYSQSTANFSASGA